MAYRSLFLFIFNCFILVLSSCGEKTVFDYDEWREDAKDERWGPEQDPVSVTDTTDYCWPADSLLHRKYSGVETARRRARQLAEISWKPYAKVPSCYGSYPKNEVQEGIPYSLAYMTNTQVGTQVSLHTYMTALQNPYSVLYSEHLGKSPYNGSTDSATYYGTTCSSSVMYVLGIEPPYYTRMFGIIPGMKKAKEQDPSSIQLCDVLWKTGHVMLVYVIIRNADNEIVDVSLFETTTANQGDTRIRHLSYSDFVSYWEKYNVIRYQYAYLDQNTDYEISVFSPLEDEPALPYRYNYELCPTLGDRCSYLEGQTVRLAVVNQSYPEIALYRNNELYRRIEVRYPLTSILDLPYGKYKACLVRDDFRSGYVRFEVLNAEAGASLNGRVDIRFSSKNASPRYVSFCNSKGSPYNYYPISDEQRENGLFEMKSINSTGASHYQVFFRGEYGVVATPVKEIK